MFEKEAEEWIKDHSGLIGSYKFVKYDYDSLKQAYLTAAEPREKRIADLEAKNAKLKEQNNKAKVIIERLMDIINHDLKCFDTMAGLDVKQKAEQFLKGVKEND